MEMGLAGKIVIVTGGGVGIGAAISLACAAEGAVPVIVNHDGPDIQATLSTLREKGREHGFFERWLRTPEDCAAAVEHALERYGRVDGLVNNIGVNDGVGLEHGTPERFMASLQGNLWHFYCMAHYALPSLKEHRGSIVNIGSKVACTGQGGTSGYAAAKGGVLALTREWAVELLPYGIRVNAVVPSEVKTPAYDQWLATFPDPEEKLEEIVGKIPLGGRMTTPAEIAASVVFLLSKQSSHTTGQHVFVDGGYVHLDRAVEAQL
jgi:NAD(P)-dependent dehydrogenase (short-subunit alcohol dehydrogenase family)